MKPSINILISGGGTGGHIYPAISIANELKKRYPQASFLFVGASDRMEMEKVPQAGYAIEGLHIAGIQRSLSLKNLSFPFKLVSSVLKARRIVKKFKPTVAIGTGGYASGPTLFVASSKRIPTLIQEQNSYPGITNKLLGKKVDRICVAYDGLERFFPKEKLLKTGNPVRQDLLYMDHLRADALSHFELKKERKTLLILGGSLGAKAINELIDNQVDWLLEVDLQIIWQTGKLYYDKYHTHGEKDRVQTHAFLERMDLAYAAADFIISRAGASSISELCLVGKPTIFIPSPNVAEDHQTKNALAVVEKNGAILLEEKNLNLFKTVIEELIIDESKQQLLADNMRKMGLPNATQLIVDEIEKLIF